MTTCFVILASMRTGSNLLNTHVNQYAGVICHGEVFNPAFIGLTQEYLNRFGLDRSDVTKRDADPLAFLEKVMALDAAAVGIHMFPGHDTNVLERLLVDASVKKICLRRSVFHSFVSLQVAKKTDIWRVTKEGPRAELPIDARKVVFKTAEFEEYRRKLDQFWDHSLSTLARSTQTYLPIWYRELNDVHATNRIAEFLGLSERKKALTPKLDKQNPEPLKHIVVNWEEMVDYARKIGMFHQV
jgi:LPS sulfotransferase NodH